MTALRKYARLETIGLWRSSSDAQRREVAVQFGEASLVLSDLRTEVPLTHWSLPAVLRINPGEMPALYKPTDDPTEDSETLEIDEPGMVDAIETVRTALSRRRRRKGRGRRTMLIASALVAVAAAVIWLPDALVNHTSRVVPFVKRQEIGRELLGAMTRYTGAPCAGTDGLKVLSSLSTRLFGADGPQLVVLRDGLAPETTSHAPGSHLLIDRRLIENYESPEVLAGHLLVERARIDSYDPLSEVLRSAGTRATFTLLATGNLPKGTLAKQAQLRLQSPAVEISDDVLIKRFAEARVTLTPYASTLSDKDHGAALSAKDPLPPADAKPLLYDSDWLALQNICSR